MPVEIRKDFISFTIPARFSSDQSIVGVDLEHHIVKKGEPIDLSIVGIPHRCPGVLSGVAKDIKDQAAGFNNGVSQFAYETANSLEAVTEAINNSEEF